MPDTSFVPASERGQSPNASGFVEVDVKAGKDLETGSGGREVPLSNASPRCDTEDGK